jgi:hypothetical protein
MTALVTASLAVVAWIIARIAFASGSRGKSGLTATTALPTQRFSSVYVAGSRSTVTRTGLVRIAVRPGSRSGSSRCAAAPAIGSLTGFLRAAIALPPLPARHAGGRGHPSVPYRQIVLPVPGLAFTNAMLITGCGLSGSGACGLPGSRTCFPIAQGRRVRAAAWPMSRHRVLPRTAGMMARPRQHTAATADTELLQVRNCCDY